MRPLLPLFLILLMGWSLAASTPKLRLPVEEANPRALPSTFGELELAEVLRNPNDRKSLVGLRLDVVGELTLFSKPDQQTGRIKSVGFGKTHGKVIYRIWCKLREPMTQDEFDRISTASFVTLRGKCSVSSRTKAVGSDLWYDLSVSLDQGEVVYWEAPK